MKYCYSNVFVVLLLKVIGVNANFIGCWEDRSSRSFANYYAITGITNTICLENCRNLGFVPGYMGTENGLECYCGTSYRTDYAQYADSACASTCSGDSSQICGGPWKLSVYVTDYQGWGSWGSWGSCSTTCGIGTQTRTRSCADFISSSCTGDTTDAQGCFSDYCTTGFTTSGQTFTSLTSYGLQAWDRHFFVFEVQGSSNAHVLIGKDDSYSTDSYCILIGGWSNTRTAIIRRGKDGDIADSIDESNTLSTSERRRFYITWDGSTITYGKVSNNYYEEILSYTDSSPITMNYLLVSSWASHTLSWYIVEPGNYEIATPGFVFVDISGFGVVASERDILVFYGRACSDVIFALSAAKSWASGISGYEVVIGGWTNSQSVIRTEYTGTEQTVVSTVSILDCNVAKLFYVSWTSSRIAVGTVTARDLTVHSEFMALNHGSNGKDYFLPASWSSYTAYWEFILDCGPPPAIYGAQAYTSNNQFKSTATYTCKTNYVSSGASSASAQCQDTGRWTTTSLTCLYDCGTPPSISNAAVSAPSTTETSTATYTCSTGYNPSTTTTITCQPSGWSSTSLICQLNDCGTSPDLQYSTKSAPVTTYQSKAAYSCNRGYDPSTSPMEISCGPSVWESITFSCDPHDCGVPGDLANAAKSHPDTTYPNIATYTCNTGYNPSTSPMEIACGPSGWSTITFSCIIHDCLDPPDMANSTKSYTTTTYQSKTTYSCDLGYDPSTTPLEISCGPVTWDAISFSCDPHECGVPSAVSNADVLYVDTTYLHVATYNCNVGYDASISPMEISCSPTGWTSATFTCDAHECEDPQNLNDSTKSAPLTYYPNKATYTCDPGHDPDDPFNQNMQIACGPFTWETMSFWCKPKDCLVPVNSVPHSTVSYTTTIFYTVSTSTAEWICNTGYILDPETVTPIVDCLVTGVWDTVSWTCIFNYCKNISKGYDDPALLDDTEDNLSGQMYFLNDTLYMVDCCGVISGWEFQPLVEDFFQLVVWRRGDDNVPYIVGYNSVLVANKSQLMNFTVPSDEKIAVRAFDQVGWYYSGGTMLPYTDCSGQTDCPQMTLHANGPGELRENYKYDWDNAGTILSNRAYSLRFYFTKNTELVFSKTSYNASIPNHWTIGKSVLTLGLSGVDYAEVATYTMIAHTNGSDGLFDIDRFGTVKIAGVLPTGYDDESVFIYTVSAVDYCQNYANTTLTIETFNSPPLFGNLPSLIEIEETVGVSQSLFPVIVSDPTNDSICCTLEKILPQSENFILDLDRSFFIATSKKAYFSYNLINSYLVRICCQDRNFSTSSVLQVKIKKEETNSNIPVPGWVVTSLIISSVPIGLLVLTSCALLFFMVFGLT